MRNTIKIMVAVAWVIGMCGLASCAQSPPINSPADANIVSMDSTPDNGNRGQASSPQVDKVLNELHNTASNLKSYQCKVEYLFSQPVLESKTLRTGTLYYARFGNGSKLRISFDTLSQDDGPKQNYKECYIFDGQWLTHIDYQIKQVQKRQLAEANEPIDAFELAKRNFPIIGFSKTDDLQKEFEITLKEQAQAVIPAQAGIQDVIHFYLKVKPDSQYKDDYKSVEIWIDKGLMLPAKLTAVSTEDDIYEISFVAPLANEPIDEKVFEVTIPDGFGKPEIIPLKGD